MFKFKFNFLFFQLTYFVFSLFIILHPIRCLASDLYYQDFLNSSSITDFTVISNSGTIGVDTVNGLLDLTAPYGQKFPAILLNYALPVDHYGIEVRFKYPDQKNFGTGVYFSDKYPINDISPTFDDLIMYFMGEPAGPNYRYLLSNNLISEPTYVSSRYDFHTMRYERIGEQNSYYVDGELISKEISNRNTLYIWFGNTILTNSNDNWSHLVIDYVRVYSITPEPTDPPAPTDPPKPSDPPEPKVEDWYYSQKDPKWGEQEYDSAKKWSCRGINIARWGCAMTDASMVLTRYDIKDTNGEAVTPDKLNLWLKSQPDGYLRNGLTNWLAVARYAKESSDGGKSPTALEFERQEASNANIEAALTAKYLPIVNIGGHFVTIYKNQDTDNWLVADPNKSASELLPKTTPLASLNIYKPSKTDLSYFMVTTEPSNEIVITKENGDPIPLVTTKEYLKNDIESENGKELKILTLAKPATGKYKLISTNGKQTEIYLYDILGHVKKVDVVGSAPQLINYDSNNVLLSTLDKWDKVSPTIEITTPQLTRVKEIYGTANDNEGIKRVETTINYWWMRAIGINNWKLPIKYMPDGAYYVRARAIDTSDNISIDKKLITFDTTSPTTKHDTYFKQGKVITVIKAYDRYGVEKIEYKWNGEQSWHQYENELSGKGKLQYRATDKAGNVSSVKSMYVR